MNLHLTYKWISKKSLSLVVDEVKTNLATREKLVRKKILIDLNKIQRTKKTIDRITMNAAIVII
jgi:hypothetical protein